MIAFFRRLYYTIHKIKRQRYINGLIEKGMSIGNNVEIIDTFFFDPSHCFLISIGDNCTICPEVRLIAHDASTKKHLGYTKIGKITIKENCFIGDSVIVLPCVTIGENSIIGAGSVITKDIPPNTVAVGNPVRVISTIDEYISKIKSRGRGKRVFDESYYIENLDENRLLELLEEIDDEIGFII